VEDEMMNEELFDTIVVSSDIERRRQLADILIRQGADPICVSSVRECQEALAQRQARLVFCDEHVADGSYKDLLAAYRLSDRKPRLVVTSQLADWELFKEAMRSGAFDVIAAPCRPTDVEWMLIQAQREERLAASRMPQAAPAHELARAASL
jgi:DNA-binding NtrC family response regulator